MHHLGLFARARLHPAKVALVTDDERVTFADLAARAARVASLLRAHQVAAGDSVAVALRNRVEFLALVFGAALIGAEVVPVSWRLEHDEIRYLVEDSRARLLVVEDDADPPAIAPVLTLTEMVAAARTRADVIEDALDPAAALIRFYTSGTTGVPKAVVRERVEPARALEAAEQHLALFGVASNDDVHLVCGPLYHSAPLGFSTQALQCGQTVVLPSRFDAQTALRLIARERATWSFMVPTHLARIARLDPLLRARHDLSSLRRILHAGAPCPPAVKRAALDTFPAGTVWEFYGMTEGRATLASDREWLAKPGTVGRPLPGVTVKILDEQGRELAPGAVGLVYVSPQDGRRFRYAGDDAKTDQAWRGDLFTTGDMGYLDADGYLFLTDRRQDLVISGGSNVYPAEVEAVLHQHPSVADCAVFGVPDDEWGESVKAVVQAAGQVSEAELIEFCRARLAHFKCPRSIDLIGELPRDPSGKIRKRALRDPYWEGRARQI